MTGTTLKPPAVEGCEVSFPAPHILLLTITRPKQMNSITHTMNWYIENLFAWYDAEPTLRVAVITGSGTKAFCAGSDLIEIEESRKAKLEGMDVRQAEVWRHEHPRGGFAGVSRRRGKKAVLVAVNGVALGGGFEIVLNRFVVEILCSVWMLMEMLVISPLHRRKHNSDFQKRLLESMHTVAVCLDWFEQ